MTRALIFDFDGLICDTETPLIDACNWMHHQAGLPFDRALWLSTMGHDGLPPGRWSAFGSRRDAASLDAELRLREREFAASQPTLPGVLAYLEEARQMGLRCAVASNSFHSHVDGHLARLKVRHYFAAVCCRDDVTKGKPAPDVYLAALGQLGVEAAEALALEDSPTGVTAAKCANIRCIAVPDELMHSMPHDHADLILPSLRHRSLPELLAHFNPKLSQL